MRAVEVSEAKRFMVEILIMYFLAGAVLAVMSFYLYSTIQGAMWEKVLAVVAYWEVAAFFIGLDIDITSSMIPRIMRDELCGEERGV